MKDLICSIIKQLICKHDYNNGQISPFRNTYGETFYTYECSKCGKIKVETSNSGKRLL